MVIITSPTTTVLKNKGRGVVNMTKKNNIQIEKGSKSPFAIFLILVILLQFLLPTKTAYAGDLRE